MREAGTQGSVIGGQDLEAKSGKVEIDVRVQCPNWLDIDRVFVLVNGRIDKKHHYRKATSPNLFRSGVVKLKQKLTLALVLLAGAGTDPATGLAYWLVRNSWSPWWGDSGWIKIRRAVTDAEFDARCGVDLAPGDGSGCDNGPSTVTVCGTCGILFDTTLPLVE